MLADLLSTADGWIKLLGAVVAVFVAAIVPLLEWRKESHAYRTQLAAAAAHPATSLLAVGGPLANADEARKHLAVQERVAIANERIATALERVLEHIQRDEEIARAAELRAAEILRERERPGSRR